MKKSVFGAVVVLCSWSIAANAFQINSGASSGCHEFLTLDAFDLLVCPGPDCAWVFPSALNEEPSGAPDITTAKIAAGSPTRRPSSTGQQLAVYSLIEGVRFNDLHGLGVNNLLELRNLHAAVDGQEEHCLRAATDDGPEGTASALRACRLFIEQQLDESTSLSPRMTRRPLSGSPSITNTMERFV